MKYYGLYRGIIVNNDDSEQTPAHLGRVQISVPQVYGVPDDTDALPWAWPCNPVFGGGVYDADAGEVDVQEEGGEKVTSGLICIPPIGATVWVMFEQGDPQVPVLMGTWIGKEASMPSEALEDSSEDVEYPKIFLLKMPWEQNIYLRVSGSKKLEIVVDDMHIAMKKESAADAGDGELSLWTQRQNIRIATTEGTITMRGKQLLCYFDEKIYLQAGTFKTTSTGAVVVDEAGDVDLIASGNTKIHTEVDGVIQTGEEGSWQCRAFRASGFEKHTGQEGA